jgi:two-component system CheB/CheR fusion protein
LAVVNADARAVHLRRLQILIADDNVDLAESFAELLRASGHQVDVVHDGEAALHMARTRVPDIALLDIGMPKRDGYEVARQLRARPGLTSALLIALTGYGQADARDRALDAGFDAHLTKPVAPDDLSDFIASRLPEQEVADASPR